MMMGFNFFEIFATLSTQLLCDINVLLQINEMINKYFLTGDKSMIGIDLRQHGI